MEEKENNLQKIVNYLNTNLDIINVLGITQEFFNRQVDSSLSQSGIMDNDPTSIGKIVQENDIRATLKTIQSYKENLENQRDQLKDAIIKTKVFF